MTSIIIHFFNNKKISLKKVKYKVNYETEERNDAITLILSEKELMKIMKIIKEGEEEKIYFLRGGGENKYF